MRSKTHSDEDGEKIQNGSLHSIIVTLHKGIMKLYLPPSIFSLNGCNYSVYRGLRLRDKDEITIFEKEFLNPQQNNEGALLSDLRLEFEKLKEQWLYYDLPFYKIARSKYVEWRMGEKVQVEYPRLAQDDANWRN